jgi:hypothetical protein
LGEYGGVCLGSYNLRQLSHHLHNSSLVACFGFKLVCFKLLASSDRAAQAVLLWGSDKYYAQDMLSIHFL